MGSNTELDYGGLTLLVKSVKTGASAPGQSSANNTAVALTGTGGTSTGTMTTTTALVTTAALTTAGAATHVATITYTGITASDMAVVTSIGGTNTVLNYTVKAVCSANTITMTISNNTAATALNGTLSFAILVIKA